MRVHIPADRRDPFVRVPFQELTARLQSGRVRPSHVGARKRLTPDGKSRRQIRIAARVARADHELSAIALRANRRVDAFAPNGEADIVRAADAGLDEQLRYAGGEHRAVFEPVVRDAEISVVANQAAAAGIRSSRDRCGCRCRTACGIVRRVRRASRRAGGNIALRTVRSAARVRCRDTRPRTHRCPSDRRPKEGRRQSARRQPSDRPTPLPRRTRRLPAPRRTVSSCDAAARISSPE